MMTLMKNIITQSWLAAASVAIISVVTLLTHSWWETSSLSAAAHSLDFTIRDSLGRSPQISPQMRIFAFEEAAPSENHQSTEAYNQLLWHRAIKALALAQPKIVILGSDLPAHELVNDLDLLGRETQHRLRIAAPVDFAATNCSGVGGTEVAWEPISAIFAPTGISSFLESLQHRPGILCTRIHTLRNANLLFGLAEADRQGMIAPIVRSNSVNGIRNLGMVATDSLSLEPGTLLINGQRIPLSPSGTLPVNPIPLAKISAKVRPLTALADAVEQAVQRPEVVAGDVVVLIGRPPQETPNPSQTDSLRQQQNVTLIATLNSSLTNSWLLRFPHKTLLVAISGVAALVCTLLLNTRSLILVTTGGTLIYFISGQILLSFGGIQIPWLLGSIAWLGGCVPLTIGRLSGRYILQTRLREALANCLPPDQVNQAVNSDSFRVQPTERTVTILYADISGFSIVSEQLAPKLAFEELRNLIHLIKSEVHKAGGIVESVSGEVITAFFGYNFANETQQTSSHASDAISCALIIQRHCVNHIMGSEKSGRAAYPVRIAINTTHAYIGCLGTEHHFAFHLLGYGSHFVRMLLSVCESFRVVLSYSTHAHLNGTTFPGMEIRKRLSNLQNQDELVEVYEADPFAEQPDLLEEATGISRDYAKVSRLEERYVIPPGRVLQMATPFGLFDILNFSLSGFAARGSHYFAKGVTIRLSLETPDGQLHARLNAEGLLPLHADVRWGSPTKRGFVHGLHLSGLTEEQRRRLLQILKEQIATPTLAMLDTGT